MLLSRVCQQFPCFDPWQARRAIEEDPEGLVLAVLEARTFEASLTVYDRAKSKDDIPKGRMMDLVIDIDFAAARERLRRREGDQ